MTEIPNATEMRARMLTLANVRRDTQIQDLHKRIHEAVKKGQSSIRVTRWETGVKELVESKGYVVTFHGALDQRDSDEWEVSW